MITEFDAIKFQKLYKEETGEEVSLEEAFDCAESLVDMIRLVWKPIKKKDYGKCTDFEVDI